MPHFILEKPNYETYFLLEGHFLGLRFDQGFVFFRILGRERSNIKPFDLGSVSGFTAQSSFNRIQASSGDELLDPFSEDYINHFFVGIKPANVRIYVNFPAGDARMSLRGSRPVPAAVPTVAEESIGYIDAAESPYEEPGVSTEIITVRQLYPEYKAFNPTNTSIPEVLLHFPIMRYRYKLITDTAMAKQFLDGQRRCRFYSIGGVVPTSMPDWLATKEGVSVLAELTKKWVS